MKVKLLPAIIAACAFFSTSFAVANSYQTELKGSYGEIDFDDSPADLNNTSLQGTYYFSPVDTANRPLAESAFLQKASSVYVGGSYLKYKENDSAFDSSERGYSYNRSAGVDFYIPNSIFFVGAGINEFKYKYEWKEDDAIGRETSDWESQWYVKAGVAPIDGLLVWSEFYEDIDVSESWNINAKYVMPIGRAGQWLNLEASYEDSSDNGLDAQTLTLAGDYYLDTHLSVGAGLTHYSVDNDDGNSNENEYFVRANQYFTDNFALNLNYSDGDYESRWTVGAVLRF